MKVFLLSIIIWLAFFSQQILWYNFDNNKNITKKEIVANFCKESVNIDKTTFIDSSKSVFLKILCDSTKIYDDKENFYSIDESKLKTEYYDNLVDNVEKNKLTKWILSECSLAYWIPINDSSLNNVDFTCVAKDIFDNLADDYINLATYIAYGWWNEDIKKFEKDFFIWKYCSISYLNSSNDNNKWCKHPETYKYVSSINSSLKNVLKNLNLFKNINSIKDIYNLLGNKTDKANNEYFLSIKNHLYNELYFYSVFLTYYSLHISGNSSSTSLKMAWNNITKFKVNNMKEYIEAQKNITIARLSVKKSLNIISNIYWSYPIHVWFLAITEDFKKLRDSLVKIYTPLDQLRYKLKNVQDLDKH